MADPASADHSDYRAGKVRLARGGTGREDQNSV